MTTILHISSSTTGEASNSKLLAGELLDRLKQAHPGATVKHRHLAKGIPLLTEAATAELPNAPGDYSDEASAILEASDTLIAELEEADVLVIGAPIYNFSTPASLKAWADLITRAGRTFHYTDEGPQGLLNDRPTYVVTAAGGVPIGSDADFGTRWLTFHLNFLGITNVTTVGGSNFAVDPEAALAAARESIASAPLPN